MREGPSPLEKIVRDVLKKMGVKRPGEEEVGDAWAKAVGDAAAKHSRPVSLRKSVLTVHVDGSGWLYELTTRKREILAGLAQDLTGRKKIKDVRLRIGDIAPPAAEHKG